MQSNESMNDVLKRLFNLSIAPQETEAFNAWLGAEDALTFLADNAKEDEFVVYASIEHTFIHAVLVPVSLVNPPDIED